LPVSSQPPAAPSPADPVSGPALSPLPEPPTRRATIRDVAARVGVSIGTASKALNGQGKLRAETRDRVAAAARELGFAPNVLARGLLAGRTYTVGVITTDSFGRFSIPVMLGAEDALGADQISVFMCDTRDDPDRERQYLNMLLSRQVDGLIVAGRRTEPRPSIGLGLGIPVVYAMTQSMDSDEPAILPDDTGWGRLRRARRRVRRVERAVGPGGGPGGAGQYPGRRRDLLRQRPDRPRRHRRAAADRQARSGGHSGGRLRPPLTSVDMCLEHVGRMAAEHLMLAINGEPTHGVHTVPCRLVSRGSTATEVGEAGERDGHGLLRTPARLYPCRRSRNSVLPRVLGSCANL
jgi:LacI family transcriptional regulator, galactose operon repressor